jgi:hypothetical protein
MGIAARMTGNNHLESVSHIGAACKHNAGIFNHEYIRTTIIFNNNSVSCEYQWWNYNQ